MKDPEIHSQIMETTTKHKRVYGVITDTVNAMLGTQCTESQIRYKIKSLQAMYKRMASKRSSSAGRSSSSKGNNAIDGADDEEEWSYFDDMEEIMTREVVGGYMK